MSGSAIVTVTREMAASPERAFDAWIEPGQAKQFLFKTRQGEIVRCDIDARVGGRFFIVDRRPSGDAEHYGQFIEIDRPKRLVFLFRGPGTQEGDWSKVTVEITPSSSGSVITLTHEIPTEWATYAEPVRNGWTMILDTLAVETEKKNG